MMRVRWVVLAVALGLLAGCSRNKGGVGPPTSPELQELSDLLHTAAGASGRPPARLADLDRYKGMYPRAYEAVKSGELVVLWGSPLKGEGDTGKNEAVVAYEKKVPGEGGYVLLSAGTVKQMTPAEFNAAPKGK
jgi:hypothetical protein